jgi:hypothetical protein
LVPEYRATPVREILASSWSLFRDHFGVLFGIAAVLAVPVAILGLLGTGLEEAVTSAGTDAPVSLAAVYAGLALLTGIVVSPLVGCALVFAAGELRLGRPVTIGSALRAALPRIFGISGTFLLATIATLVGLLLLILPGLYLVLAFVLWPPVVMFEGRAGVDALGRSQELMRGSMLRLLAVYCVLVGIGLLLILPATLLSAFPLANVLGSALLQALGMAYNGALVVVLYFNARASKDTPEVASAFPDPTPAR